MLVSRIVEFRVKGLGLTGFEDVRFRGPALWVCRGLGFGLGVLGLGFWLGACGLEE